jgi:hypothetical protein
MAMTGIFGRVDPDATDRLAVHLVGAGLVLEARGDFTPAQVLAALNSVLESPLAGAELTDLTNLETQMDNETGTVDKIAYVRAVESIMIAIELGALTNETAARTALGV